MRPLVLVVLAALTGCTSILGDFEISNALSADGHCKEDVQCQENFHPTATCEATDAGKICIAHLPADAGTE